MFKQIKEFFTGKPAEVVAEVPYKVEVPAEPTPVVVQATEAMVTSVAPVVETKPAKKAPAAKKTVAKKAPAAKKPRAPRAPKVAK
jgi:hypothetical protein